jgi:thiamine pyrophosphokinase
VKFVVIYLGGQGPAMAPTLDGEIVATIAADSGLLLADAHGAKVDLVVGDMDSVDAGLLAKYENEGTIISRFPHEKNETDFELAVMAAMNYVADELVVLGGGGGRTDHLISNLAILSGIKTEKWKTQMHTNKETIFICRPGQVKNIDSNFDNIVSLVPMSRSVSGVKTQNLKWELKDETLEFQNARGMSNVCLGNSFSVKIDTGTLAIFCPST